MSYDSERKRLPVYEDTDAYRCVFASRRIEPDERRTRWVPHIVEAATGPGGGGHPIDIAPSAGSVTGSAEGGTEDQPSG